MSTKASIHVGHDAQAIQEVTKGIVEILNQKVDQITLMSALEAFKEVVKLKDIIISNNKFEMNEDKYAPTSE